MGEFKLSHELTSVLQNGHISFGGSQSLSENKQIQRCGCGLIAACDLFLYMHRHLEGCHSALFESLPCQGPIELDQYRSLLDSLRMYFPLIPNLGINGIMLSLGINSFFLRYSYPYKAVWAVRSDRLWDRIESMLATDIPVIISVGPNISLSRNKYKADMYTSFKDGEYRRTNRVSAHYMTVCALDDQWLTVSSWGRKYFISRSDFRIYVKHHSSSIVSNIVYITRK